MEQCASQDPRSYSLYFDLNIWLRAWKVTGTFEKRVPVAKRYGTGSLLASICCLVRIKVRKIVNRIIALVKVLSKIPWCATLYIGNSFVETGPIRRPVYDIRRLQNADQTRRES